MSMTANVLLTLAMDARLRLAKLKLPESAVEICMAGLARMEQVLARPPRVAIIGEVNAGKTSVAELLLGAGILPSSVVANTRVPIRNNRRPLDTQFFASPVRYVHPKVIEGPSPSVRIEIYLRDKVPYREVQSDNVLSLYFQRI